MSKTRQKQADKPSGGGKSRAARAGRNLVIVESPAKAKTINRYLGDDYVVAASMGHVRDLPSSDIGVEIDNRFQPHYEPLQGRKKVIGQLRKLAREAPEVFLATDLDREGEAIAWHLAECLGLDGEHVHRVIFNEITANAIREAFAHPRTIDMDKVNAQQARRILDRIVGYQISPLLWRKVSPGLSAGRVQSVAVRLIVEREREIDAFTPEEYWKIGAIFTVDAARAGQLSEQWRAFMARTDERGNGPNREAQQKFLADHDAFRAELVEFAGQRFRCDDEQRALEVARALGLTTPDVHRRHDEEAKGPARNVVTVDGRVAPEHPPLAVESLKRRESRSKPPAPFITSSLQQAASTRLRFGAQRTMRVAQQLYEGVELPGLGQTGLITYMRTDSRHLSNDAVGKVRGLIAERFGPEYVPDKPNVYGSAQRAQEAHEAIRPTDASLEPDRIRSALSDEQYKLYSLIWRQFVACQMPPALWTVTEANLAADTSAGKAVFKAIGRTLKFDGFMRVAGVPRSGDQILPELAEGQPVEPVELDPTQHFTQPPPRYTEAALVKALEAEGIGRPSTYASIIETIQKRKYVRLEERTFRPTDVGKVVTDKLVKHFPGVFDVRFTAKMEDQLDEVEEKHADWVRLLQEFYGPFHERLEKAGEEMVHAKAETEPSDYTCEQCGRPMVYRFSKNGRFLACTGYPECKATHPVDEKGRKVTQQTVDVACPECGEAMTQRRGRYGPFLSCSNYPDCKGLIKLDRKGGIKPPSAPPLTVDLPCPKCGAKLNLRRSARGPWLSCSKYPKCRGRQGWKALEDDQRAALTAQLEAHERAHPLPTYRRMDGTPIQGGEKPDQRPEE